MLLRRAVLYCSMLGASMLMASTPQPTEQNTKGTQPYMIVFDLDGVLLQTSRWQAAQYALLNCFLSIICESLWNGNIQKRFFQFMDNLDSNNDTSCIAYDPKGPQLPAMMHKWLAGRPGYTSQDLIPYLTDKITASSLPYTTRSIFTTLVNVTFDPQLRARFTHVIPEGRSFLNMLKQHHPNCQYAILSNYDRSCFQQVSNKKDNQEIFQQFERERICISSDMDTLKPDLNIFRRFCDHQNVSPESCIFIDDQDVNVQAARSIGMHAVQFDPARYRDIYQQVDELLTKKAITD